MQPAPDMPESGLDGWSPGKLIFTGILIGFLLSRLIEPTPPVRVVRFQVIPGGGPDLGGL